MLLSLLFANSAYANNTTVLKKRNHTINHSSSFDKTHRVHVKYNSAKCGEQKLHVAHLSGDHKHAEAKVGHSTRVHTILAKGGHTSMSKGSGLLARNLTDEQIGSILDHYRVSDDEQSTILTSINNASAKHHVNKALIVAIIARESSFKRRAVSSAGAKGLMQIMPSHHVPNPFSIPTNIDHGTAILAKYIDDAGSLDKGLSVYGNSHKYVGEVYATLRALDRLV